MIRIWLKIFEKNSIFLIRCKFNFVRFLTNISNKFSMMKYNFWCYFRNDVCEINEQIIVAIFNVFDIIFDLKIEKRENFDAITERETISIQNICFRNVAIDVDIDITNKINENEISMIYFDWLTDNVNINVESLDVKIAKNLSRIV